LKHFLNYIILTLLAVSCSSHEFKPADIGLEYFPLRAGYYQTYTIDEVLYSEVAEPETLAYQLKVQITDSFPNNDGTFTYVLHRSKRPDANSAWENLDTWSVRGDDRELIVNEGNIPFVKLTFPLKRGNAWNGNKFNSHDEDEYEVVALDQSFTAGGTIFDKTLTVLQENNEDLIVFLDERKEVYARGVGLIYKEAKQLHYCTADNCRGQQKIESGSVFKQELIEYGNQ
jgi:hypothetical protein